MPVQSALSCARAILTGATVAVLALLVTGCGTVLVDTTFVVAIEDPSEVLPPGPVEVSVFDSTMGTSDEWASKTMGATSPGQPYVTSFKSTATKMIGDTHPSTTVTTGLAIPGYQPKAYFSINLTPVNGQTTTSEAPFIGYYDYSASRAGAVPPLPIRVTGEAGELSWRIHLDVRIPGK